MALVLNLKKHSSVLFVLECHRAQESRFSAQAPCADEPRSFCLPPDIWDRDFHPFFINFVTLLRSSVFGGVLPMFCIFIWLVVPEKCLAKILFFLGSVFETHFRERVCQYSVGAFFGALGGGSVWSGLVLPFFLRAIGIFRPTPIFERGQMLLLPLPPLQVAAAAFAALAAAVAVVAVAAPVAPAVAVSAAAVAAAAAPALETTQRRVAWPLRKDDYAQVESSLDKPRALCGKTFGSKLLDFSFCVRLVFFGLVLPMFLLYYVALFSRKLPEKFSSCQVRL